MANSISRQDLMTLLVDCVMDDYEARQHMVRLLPDWMLDEELETALEEAVGRGYIVAYSMEADPGKFVPEPYRRYEGSWREEKYPCQFFYVSESGRQLVDSAPMSIWERYIAE